MRHHVFAAAAIAALACSKHEPAPAQASPAPQAAASGLKEFTAPQAAPPAGSEPFVIDGKALDAYVAFKREIVAETRKAIVDMGDRASMRGGDPLHSAVRLGTEGELIGQRLEAKRVALLREKGLGEAQVRAIDDLVLSTLSARNMAPQRGTIAQIREQIATLPLDQRARAEAELVKMEQRAADMVNAKEARARFGNAAVQLVLDRESELAAVQQDGVGLLAQ